MTVTVAGAALPYSHELDWPAGMTPMKVIDDDGAMAEPFEQYAWMRKNAPVVRMKTDGEDVWMIARYDDVRAASRAPKVFGSQPTPEAPRFTFLPQFDAPEHTRLRQAYARAFNPKSVELVEDSVRERAARFIDEFIATGGGDIQEGLSVPLTMSTIGAIMDIPANDVRQLKDWSDEVLALHARGRGLPTTDTAEESASAFFDYLQERLESLYVENSESVGGHLAKLWKEGLLSTKEVRELAGFLFVAGHDTTTLLIGNATRQLIADPSLLERIRKNPADAALFVEELARYRGTVHRTTRRLRQTVEVAGVTIPEGALVRLLIASANRDESKFPNPHVFDIDRNTDGHFGFGYGAHSCIGAPLARLETRIAIELLAQKVQRIDFDQEHPMDLMPGHMLTLGPKSLSVTVTPVIF